MIKIIFYENVVNERYFELIDYFSNKSDYVTLQIRGYVGKSLLKTKEEIMNLGKVYEKEIPNFKITDDWIRFTFDNIEKNQQAINLIEKRIQSLSKHIVHKYYSNEYVDSFYGNKSSIYVFEVCKEIIDYLKEVNSLFDWSGDRPDDLCFYKGRKCLMSSNSHENEFSIYCKEIDDLKKISFTSKNYFIQEINESPSLIIL